MIGQANARANGINGRAQDNAGTAPAPEAPLAGDAARRDAAVVPGVASDSIARPVVAVSLRSSESESPGQCRGASGHDAAGPHRDLWHHDCSQPACHQRAYRAPPCRLRHRCRLSVRNHCMTVICTGGAAVCVRACSAVAACRLVTDDCVRNQQFSKVMSTPDSIAHRSSTVHNIRKPLAMKRRDRDGRTVRRVLLGSPSQAFSRRGRQPDGGTGRGVM